MNYIGIAFKKREIMPAWLVPAINAVGAIAGGVIQGIRKRKDERQLRQQGALNEQALQSNMRMSAYNMDLQKKMWEETGPVGQMAQYKKAGLNPGLMYGMGGGGGQSTGSVGGSGVVAGSAPSGSGREQEDYLGMGIQSAGQLAQMLLLKAQKENVEANTNKTNVEASKLAGVDTENVKSQTANNILEGVIKDYTGREVKAQFEDVKQPNRGVEAKTWQDELEARQGVAGTIYEMWESGKLAEKSNAEVEAILLGNAKSREEKKNIMKQFDILEETLKGAKLENVMKELESKLQTQTGIDRNSPAWMKIIGRLFITLFGGGK